jgi:hypothetical protein
VAINVIIRPTKSFDKKLTSAVADFNVGIDVDLILIDRQLYITSSHCHN